MNTLQSRPRRCGHSRLPNDVQADRKAGRLTSADTNLYADLMHLERDGAIVNKTNAQLAAYCGVSLSGFKKMLARLRALGHLAVVKVRSLWRRVLVFTWLRDPATVPDQVSQSAQPLFVQVDREATARYPESTWPEPLAATPPITPSCEGAREEKQDDDGCDGANPPAEAEPSSSSSISDSAPIPIPPKATPEQVDEVVAKAAKILPEKSRTWVVGQMKRWSLRWVRAALSIAEAKRSECGSVGTGYVIRTLEGFKAEGGPPAELARPAETPEEREARIEAMFTPEALAKLPDVF